MMAGGELRAVVLLAAGSRMQDASEPCSRDELGVLEGVTDPRKDPAPGIYLTRTTGGSLLEIES